MSGGEWNIRFWKAWEVGDQCRLLVYTREVLRRDFFQTDLWSAFLAPPAGVALHVIKASESEVLSNEALRRLDGVVATHRACLHVVPGGHWIHADNPEEVVRLLARHLP